ncbi:ATP-dependent DNA/RNA helicase DHX36 [Lucilia sericata]|uniref:ATP-dependent DNA/RNA helicase DHX36 n=1 Tax=Lucilia sericata TaxID=13632 RepID=UPI0018A7E9C8|nr:ATP-dependent DNA/RNA helicase DHX36 [Lucilia sericata]
MSEYRRGRGGRGGRGGGGGSGGRPPWLKGKDIGLYYRDRQRQRNNEEERNGRIKLNPSVDIPSGVLAQVENCLQEFEKDSEDERVCDEFAQHFRNLLDINFEEFLEKSKKSVRNTLEHINLEVSNERLKTSLMEKEESQQYRKRYDMRQRLPAMKQRQDVLKAIEENQVVLIVGSTGCGKTTQVPQILLDEFTNNGRGAECRIVCTQPRRISAISVAERVAYERDESLGSSVGYQIRLENRLPRDYGSILYCTTGILLQKMQSNPLLIGINIIILDEIHERSVESDLLMALLKKILPHRADLKVILMSATVSEETFCEYFNNCFTLYIEGTLFPVEVLYLEDVLQETGFTGFENLALAQNSHGRGRRRDGGEAGRNNQYNQMISTYLPALQGKYNRQVVDTIRKYKDTEGCENLLFLEHLIFYICENKPPGAILVFLPGFERISKLTTQLQKPSTPKHRELAQKIQVYPLHSMMPTVNQKSIFKPAPDGMRKVILSTILAETSVTIDDVVYVINTGKTKNKDYDISQNIQTLEEQWVSKANTQQRKGRAGRVQPGICYNLFTRIRERLMLEVPIPEILRSKLESIILNLKLLHISNPYEFLKTLISVPNEQAISHGLNLLKRIEALDVNDNLTPLGLHLAHLPIDPQMGKMILMSALFRCLDPITSAAAGLSYKSPFYTPMGLEKKVDAIKRELSNNCKSDHLLIHNVIEGYREAKDNNCHMNYCYENFLSHTTLTQIENMKRQFADLLKNSSFLESSNCCDKSSNVNSSNVPLLRAIIAAGLYPNIAFLRQVKQVGNRCHALHKMSTPEDNRVNFHPSSINCGQTSFDSNYFVYLQKQRSKEVYLLDATMVFPMALLIFGDGVKKGITAEKQPYISVANKYFFKCNENSSLFILRLREKLGILLQKKALYPSPIEINSKDEKLIKAIQILLSLDDAGDLADQFLSTDDEDDGSIPSQRFKSTI